MVREKKFLERGFLQTTKNQTLALVEIWTSLVPEDPAWCF